jgi:RimJ/RimL family protein N-acetyltransferase
MTKSLELESPRLLLRQWVASDREPFAALNSDPTVMRYFPSLLTRARSDAIADRCEALIAQRGWGPWAVELKASKTFIGMVGLSVHDELPISPGVEILWRLAKAHWHQGFATEAARVALRVGFELADLTEIVSFAVVANKPSRAVMERLGMEQDAETFEHPAVPAGSPLRVHCNYRLTREKWLGQCGG